MIQKGRQTDHYDKKVASIHALRAAHTTCHWEDVMIKSNLSGMEEVLLPNLPFFFDSMFLHLRVF